MLKQRQSTHTTMLKQMQSTHAAMLKQIQNNNNKNDGKLAITFKKTASKTFKSFQVLLCLSILLLYWYKIYISLLKFWHRVGA